MRENTKIITRKIDGVFLLDKPPGITSNDALQKVKRIFKAKKAGHTGSLDPLASGMLPICLGAATKFSQYLLEADKTYLVTCKLGIKTNTGDAEGEVIARKNNVSQINEKKLNTVLDGYKGEIEQIPSMYSAIKHQGQPLYKLARKGITVDRKLRKVSIYKLDVLGFEKDVLVLMVVCSKGTYVRTLVEDIGEDLGCGAHVIALRRLDVGHFQEQQMVSLNFLQELSSNDEMDKLDALLLPVEVIVEDLPEVKLSEAAAYYLRQGQAIISPYASGEGIVRLKMKDDRFIGIGEILADGKVAPKRLLV